MAAVPVDARYRCGKSLNFRSAVFVPSRAPRPKSNGKDTPASIPPASGAAQKSHNSSSAQPPATSAGPVERAGFTDAPVTGIVTT